MIFENEIAITTDSNQSPMRIDKFLVNRLNNLSRNKIQNLIKEGYITIGNSKVQPNYNIKPDTTLKVSLPYPKRTELIPEKINLNILYEDEDLLLVNKPAGMVVHPACNNWTGTLVNGLLYHYKNLPNKKGNIGRPGLVHRIDKDTSGILVIAKNEFCMQHLAKQFHDHSIERKYVSLVWGTFIENNGTIDEYLTRSMRDRKIITVTKDYNKGKNAITHYKVLKNFRYTTLIECTLETGRTHQIRSHMKHAKHPIFNDINYGGNIIHKGPVFSKYRSFIKNCFKIMPTMTLHAKSLKFIHPKSNKNMFFESELPTNFQSLIKKWEDYHTTLLKKTSL